MEFHLMRGKELVGVLRQRGTDHPWIICDFQPTHAFSQIEPLFEEELRFLDSDDMEAWHGAYDCINALGLTLISTRDENEVGEFLLHIRDDEAWIRY